MPLPSPMQMTEEDRRRMKRDAAMAFAQGRPPPVPTTNPSGQPTQRQGNFTVAPGQQQQQRQNAGQAQALSQFSPTTGQPMGGQAAAAGRLQGAARPTAPPPNSVQGIPPPASPPVQVPIQSTVIPTSGVQTTDPNGGTYYPQGDDRYQAIIDGLLQQGPRDTSAEEKQIEDRLASTVGQGQADLNARMGAAGFGTSGALASMSGDMRRQATREALDEIMGVRKGARDEQLDRLRLGFDANDSERGWTEHQQDREQWQAIIDQMFPNGGGTKSDPDGDGSPGAKTDGGNGPFNSPANDNNTTLDLSTPEGQAAFNNMLNAGSFNVSEPWMQPHDVTETNSDGTTSTYRTYYNKDMHGWVRVKKG